MRLIVVDDDRLVVDSLKIILGAQPQIEGGGHRCQRQRRSGALR